MQRYKNLCINCFLSLFFLIKSRIKHHKNDNLERFFVMLSLKPTYLYSPTKKNNCNLFAYFYRLPQKSIVILQTKAYLKPYFYQTILAFMKRFLTALILFFLLFANGFAQTVHPISTKSAPKDVYQYYLDSLRITKDSIFNTSSFTLSPNTKKNKEVRLFMPTTYYHDIIHNAFAPNTTLSSFDKTLLNIYLQHPSLVGYSSKDLANDITEIEDIKVPIHHDADLVKKVKEKTPEPATAPVKVMITKPNFWTFKGDYSLQMMQNFVSGNWFQGGESNYAALGSVIMQANYNNKQKIKWDNMLEMRFGIQSSRSDSLHSFKSTDDLIRLTSKFGLQATKHWYYSVQLIANTQFSRSYKANDPKTYADFLAPFNLNLSVGMNYSVDWLNHKLKGNIHLAPLAYNLKYTRLLDLSSRLGIKEGKHSLHDFGSEFTLQLEWKLLEMLSWRTRLYGYTTYSRAELEWENIFSFKFNKYISTQLFIYPRFDDGVAHDDHYGFWQIKEYASVGFQYSF